MSETSAMKGRDLRKEFVTFGIALFGLNRVMLRCAGVVG
jgi:hypothetical protein